jgi:hypothetical protein
VPARVTSGPPEELEHERHLDQLLLGDANPELLEKLDQRLPTQPRWTMLLRIPSQELIECVLHVLTLYVVVLKDDASRSRVIR